MPTTKKTETAKKTPAKKTEDPIEKRLKQAEKDIESLAQQVALTQLALTRRLGVDLVEVAAELDQHTVA